MRRRREDEGYSLVEVMVAASLMAVVTAVTLTAIIQIYSGVNRAEETVTVRDRIDVSFRRLDKELRYATWISDAKAVNGRWYFEYALPPVTDSNNVRQYPCRQVALDKGVLTMASWNQPSTNPGTPFTIAEGVTADATKGPVEIYMPEDKSYALSGSNPVGVGTAFEAQYVQIRLRFTVNSGKVTLPFDSIYTTQNIDRDLAKRITSGSLTSDCSKGRPTA
jgi:prepilin-type N-terminal cleavage/methylation domain-containing protein